MCLVCSPSVMNSNIIKSVVIVLIKPQSNVSLQYLSSILVINILTNLVRFCTQMELIPITVIITYLIIKMMYATEAAQQLFKESQKGYEYELTVPSRLNLRQFSAQLQAALS